MGLAEGYQKWQKPKHNLLTTNQCCFCYTLLPGLGLIFDSTAGFFYDQWHRHPLSWPCFTCLKSEADFSFIHSFIFHWTPAVFQVPHREEEKEKALGPGRVVSHNNKTNKQNKQTPPPHFNKCKDLTKKQMLWHQNSEERTSYAWGLPIRNRHLSWTLKNR